EYHRDLVDDQVLTDEHSIEGKLLELNRHAEAVIQQHLRGEHNTIDAVNAAMGEVVEPYRFLVLFDAPQGLSDRARELLTMLIESGPRTGIYTTIVSRPGAARAGGARWRATIAGLERVVGERDGFWFETREAGRWMVDLDAPPPLVPIDADGKLSL